MNFRESEATHHDDGQDQNRVSERDHTDRLVRRVEEQGESAIHVAERYYQLQIMEAGKTRDHAYITNESAIWENAYRG